MSVPMACHALGGNSVEMSGSFLLGCVEVLWTYAQPQSPVLFPPVDQAGNL